MRASKAKPRPPKCGVGVGRRRWGGEEAQVTRCCCGRGGGESFGWPGRDRRRANVEEAGASHPSSVGSRSEADGSDASAKTEITWVARESERTWRSSHRRPNVRTLVLPISFPLDSCS
jgi:hypothetical protein